MTNLKKALDDYKILESMISELQDELSTVENTIKAEMGEQEEMNVEGTRVKWTRYTTNRFNIQKGASNYV